MPVGNGNNDDDDSTYLEFCEVLTVELTWLRFEMWILCFFVAEDFVRVDITLP